jgi:hypothetical protein
MNYATTNFVHFSSLISNVNTPGGSLVIYNLVCLQQQLIEPTKDADRVQTDVKLQ